MKRYMTQAEYARHRGSCRETVARWRDRGFLVHGPDGRIAVRASDRRLDSRPAVYRGGRVVTAGGNGKGSGHIEDGELTLTEVIRRKECLAVERLQLHLDELRSRYIEREIVERDTQAEYAKVERRLMAVGGEIAAKLVPGQQSVVEITAIAQDVIHEALRQLADGWPEIESEEKQR